MSGFNFKRDENSIVYFKTAAGLLKIVRLQQTITNTLAGEKLGWFVLLMIVLILWNIIPILVSVNLPFYPRNRSERPRSRPSVYNINTYYDYYYYTLCRRHNDGVFRRNRAWRPTSSRRHKFHRIVPFHDGCQSHNVLFFLLFSSSPSSSFSATI